MSLISSGGRHLSQKKKVKFVDSERTKGKGYRKREEKKREEFGGAR